jgi:hypothetical protein
MPVVDRPLVQEIVEIGVEAVPGTAVASTVKLQSLMVELDSDIQFDRIAPSGNLWDTIAAPRQEYATGSLSGYPSYPELAYVFSNALGAAITTTPSGAVLARRWKWKPSSSVPWTPKTWTIRRGVANNSAEMAAYALLTGVGMSFSATAQPEISGDLFARALDYAASVGATGLVVPTLVPILPKQVCVYADPTFAAIGTTRLTRDFVAGFEIGGLNGPFWPLDCTIDSFGGHVPLKPDTATAMLQMGNDAQGREPVAAMRSGDTRFVRIEATGPVIDAGPPAFPHRLRIDMALKVVDAPTRGDSDGLSTLEWSFGLFDDPAFGGAIEITLDTNVSTL